MCDFWGQVIKDRHVASAPPSFASLALGKPSLCIKTLKEPYRDIHMVGSWALWPMASIWPTPGAVPQPKLPDWATSRIPTYRNHNEKLFSCTKPHSFEVISLIMNVIIHESFIWMDRNYRRRHSSHRVFQTVNILDILKLTLEKQQSERDQKLMPLIVTFHLILFLG